MDRVAAGQLLITALVVILLQIWYKRQQLVKRPPSGVSDAGPTISDVLLSPPRSPLEILYPGPADPDKVEVDIVAVHGLGSNVDRTWTWNDKTGHQPPVHWLRDSNMLPSKVPHARILSYSYESKWLANAPKTRLELCGEELVKSLHNFRTDVQRRPVIFIAHSLGGLVVMHSLLYADRTEEFKYLPACTVGFTPLGTPFRGTKMNTLAKIVAQLMRPFGSHDGITSKLEQDGKHLADEVHAFGTLRNRLNIPITCFFELYNSNLAKGILTTGLFQKRIVEEESAHVPGWGRVQLNTDHYDLNKFAGQNDRSFQAVSNEIHNMCVNLKSLIKQRELTTQDCHFMVPFGRNNDFIGRDAILEQLLETIPPNVEEDDCQRTAVVGLGGIGKTQVAIEVAYRVRNKHHIFWVPAVDANSFENAYRQIGQTLELPNINDEKADVKAIVKRGLRGSNIGSWLLIIDNLDDLDTLFANADLADYLPCSHQGSILFTTRNEQVAVQLDIPQRNLITLQEMSDDEATRFLHKGLKKSQMDDTESTTRLLDHLANLPLAIKQASAYMRSNTNVTISKYLGFCESSDTDMVELLSKQFNDRHRYPGHAKERNPIATTWLVSFKHIAQHNPQAADYLKFLCFLAEKDILLSLLPIASDIVMAEAIGILKAYAFIIERDTLDSFDMHRLVRLAMRSWLEKNGEWGQWASNVFRRLVDEYPVPKYDNRGTWTRYLPHGQTILDIYGMIDTGDNTHLLWKIAFSYFHLGKYNEAERLMRWELGLIEETLGPNHPHTLVSMYNLAVSLFSKGEHEEASKIYRQVVKLEEEKFGKRHPSTLMTMNSLVSTLITQTKYKEAAEILQQTLKLSEEILGKQHPVTLGCMNNLGSVLAEQYKFEEAERVYRQTVECCEKTLGKEHINTLNCMNNLGYVLAEQNKFEEAERIYRQMVESCEKTLGKEHLDTLRSRHNFAIFLTNLREFEEAEKVFRLTVESYEKTLGKEHPDTLKSMDDFAMCLKWSKETRE